MAQSVESGLCALPRQGVRTATDDVRFIGPDRSWCDVQGKVTNRPARRGLEYRIEMGGFMNKSQYYLVFFLVMTGCDSGVGLVPAPFSSGSPNGSHFTFDRDNGLINVFVDPANIQWGFSNISPHRLPLTNPMSLDKRESDQFYGGEKEGYIVRADRDVFFDGFSGPFVSSLPHGATKSSWLPRYIDTAVPWFHFPAECVTGGIDSIHDPACQKHLGKTVPGVVDLKLFPGVNARLSLLRAFRRVPGPPVTSFELVSSLGTSLNSNKIVVPVHFHVFVDRSGNSRTNLPMLEGLFSTQNQSKWAAAVKEYVDYTFVIDKGFSTLTTQFDWVIEEKSQLRYGAQREWTSGPPDRAFSVCDVQFSVGSVDFIAQDHRLDSESLPIHQNRFSPCEIIDTSFVGKAYKDIFHSYIGNEGVHVFVVKNVIANQPFVAGVGCSLDNAPLPFAVLVADAFVTGDVASSTLTHELAHVFGLNHPDGGVDEVSELMSGTNGDSRICNIVRSHANRIMGL